MKEALHILLVKMYWATAAVWVTILLMGLLKADSNWTVTILKEVAPVILGVVGVGFIHWIVIYRQVKKKR